MKLYSPLPSIFMHNHTHSSCPFSVHAYHPSRFSLACSLSLHHNHSVIPISPILHLATSSLTSPVHPHAYDPISHAHLHAYPCHPYSIPLTTFPLFITTCTSQAHHAHISHPLNPCFSHHPSSYPTRACHLHVFTPHSYMHGTLHTRLPTIPMPCSSP